MSALSRSLVTPTKLASVLDWKRRAVMALDIAENRINLSIGHPHSSSRDGSAIRRLDPIRLSSSKDSSASSSSSSSSHGDVAERIDIIARENDVCAVVVGWPLQPEGNPGKPCGRVLHTLENLVARNEEKSISVVSKRRPFTLWDDRHAMGASSSSPSSTSSSSANRAASDRAIENDTPPDRWGRCVAFARAPTITDGETYCSQQAYDRRGRDEDDRSERVLQHFLGSFYDNRREESSERSRSNVDYRKVTDDSWEEEEAFL